MWKPPARKARAAGGSICGTRCATRPCRLLTVAGLLVGQLIAGSVVVETVFSRDGLGRVTAAAVTAQDIPVVQGVVAFGALIFVTTNLVVDLVYPLLDPRIVVASERRARIA